MKSFGKSILLVALLAVLPLNRAAAQKDTLRILAIGNSFSVDAIEQNLWELFNAAGIPVVIGNMYIGGCTLERHWKNSLNNSTDYRYCIIRNGQKKYVKDFTLEKAFAAEDWDCVSLQQASGSSGIYSTYQRYLPSLIRYVIDNEGPDVKIMWHMTWAYATTSNHGEFPKYGKDQMKMYKGILASVKQARVDNRRIKTIIPAGTAIQNGRTSSLGDTFNRDGYHLELTYGRYTAACAWFEKLSGLSVVGNPWHPSSIDDATAEICQRAAHAACRHPWRVTKIK